MRGSPALGELRGERRITSSLSWRRVDEHHLVVGAVGGDHVEDAQRVRQYLFDGEGRNRVGNAKDGEVGVIARSPVAFLVEPQLEVAVGQDSPRRRRAAPFHHQDHRADAHDVARRHLGRLARLDALPPHDGAGAAAQVLEADGRSHDQHRVPRRDRRIVDHQPQESSRPMITCPDSGR